MVHCDVCGAANRDGSSFCNNCGKPLPAQKTNPQPIQGRSEDTSVSLPANLRGVVVFRPREIVKRLWSGSRHYITTANGKGQGALEPGLFIVSNQRVFFVKESGLFNKSYSAADVVALENIRGVSFKEGLIARALVISHERDGQIKELRVVRLAEYDASNSKRGQLVPLQSVQQALNELTHQRLHEIEIEKQKERVQYVLDFSFLKAEMEKGGVIVQTIRCPSCGAGISLPSAGTSAPCPYCGNMVYAHDVFERMKGLIGSM